MGPTQKSHNYFKQLVLAFSNLVDGIYLRPDVCRAISCVCDFREDSMVKGGPLKQPFSS